MTSHEKSVTVATVIQDLLTSRPWCSLLQELVISSKTFSSISRTFTVFWHLFLSWKSLFPVATVIRSVLVPTQKGPLVTIRLHLPVRDKGEKRAKKTNNINDQMIVYHLSGVPFWSVPPISFLRILPKFSQNCIISVVKKRAIQSVSRKDVPFVISIRSVQLLFMQHLASKTIK